MMRPGTPATKHATRQLERAAIWVVRTGAMARPTRAAALTTTPTLRPRRSGADDSSTVAVIVDQVGPSATPIKVRAASSCAKDRANPDSPERIENTKTAGTSTGLRPTRSETAPITRLDTAQAIASDEASSPT